LIPESAGDGNVHSRPLGLFQAEKGADEAEQDKKRGQGPCMPKVALGYNSNDRASQR